MLERLLYCAAPDPDQARKGQWVNRLLLCFMVLGLVAVGLNASLAATSPTGLGALSLVLGEGVVLALLFGLYLLNRRGFVTPAIMGLAVVMVAALIQTAYIEQGLAVLAYPALFVLAIIAIGIFVSPRAVLGAIIAASAITVWYYLYSTIPALKNAQAHDQQGLFFLLYTLILLFLGGGALSWLSSRLIGESLRDLRQRNEELAAAYQRQTEQIQREHELGMRIGDLAMALATVSAHQVFGVTTQASSVSQAVTALVELHNAADQIADTADEVRQATTAVLQSVGHAQTLVTTSREAVQRNRTQVQMVIERMTTLEQLTTRLTGFTNDIRDLSEETHLLALNATIEAAGAGSMGRRFGVVANEVQNLSHRASEVVDQIRMLIGELKQAGQVTLEATQGSVNVANEVESLADEVRTVQSQVTAAVQHASELAQFISAATSQQTTATAQVTQSMQQLQAVAAAHRDDTTALDRAIGELNQTASQLTVTFGPSNGRPH